MVFQKSLDLPRGEVPFYRLVHSYKTKYNAYNSVWITKELFRKYDDIFEYHFVDKKLYISLRHSGPYN